MSAPTFTAGPWKVVKSRGLNSYEIRGANGAYLADVWGVDMPVPNGVARGEAKANSRLIAAAPELYATADSLISRHDAVAKAANFDRCGCEDCAPFRPALAKAPGEK